VVADVREAQAMTPALGREQMKKTSLLAAGALAASSVVAFGGAPANAASGPLDYSCTVLGAIPSTLSIASDTDAPPEVPFGEPTGPINLTSVVDVPDTLLGTLAALVPGAVAASGTGVAQASMLLPNGTTAPIDAIDLTVPKVPLPKSGDLRFTATGTTDGFTPPEVGSYEILAGGVDSTLSFLDSSDNALPIAALGGLTSLAVPCSAPAGNNPIDTIKAVVPTTTELSGVPTSESYGQRTKATATVGYPALGTAANPLGLAPQGSVRFTVGGKSVTVPLGSDGSATATLPTMPAGRSYPVKASYQAAADSFYQSTASESQKLKVVKDGTRTAVTAPSIKRRHAEVATVKVRSAHGATVGGKVKATLKKGKKTLKTRTVSLRSGAVKVNFGKLTRKGRYSLVAKYLGNANFKASSSTRAFKVR
jgi:hypothetical protein